MKAWKICVSILFILILIVLFYFLDTRIWIDKYKMKGDTLVFENNHYIRQSTLSESEVNNLGKTIGIAVFRKRVMTDYIWPTWIIEYKDDKEHNHIFVRGLMDLGSTFIKQ
jgi:hypothetical protein